MNRLIKRFFYTAAFMVVVSVVSCSDDILPEITSLKTDRLFSPVDVEARIVNQINVRLNWKAVSHAQSYTIEFYKNGDEDFSGSPIKTIEDVTYDQVPYTVSGFDGETDYSVRIKAVGDKIDDSKWISAVFSTDAEQIFKAVNLEEVEATEVTLRWTAGETATQIILMPGNVTHVVTAGEIAAGAATISGLTPETQYVARLVNAGKTRGTVTFTTLIDLGGAIAVYPEDDLTALLQSANDGDVFALFPGEYNTQDINITKSIAVKGARPADKPVLIGSIFRVDNGAGLELVDLVLDGTGAKDNNQTIIYSAGTFGPLEINGSEIKNYVKGAFYVNNASLIESVSIRNTIYSNIECAGGDFIDFRNGLAKTFEFVNNTVYNSAIARDLFRMDGGGSTNFPGITSIITIQNNTFNNVSSNSNSRRILYIRLANEISFTKNIVANMQGSYTNQSSTNIVKLSKNNYFNAPNVVADDTGTDYTTFDPGFANPAAGDFTISNEELIFQRIGDPRWIK